MVGSNLPSNLSAEELIVIKAALVVYETSQKNQKPDSTTILLKLKVKQEIDKRLGF